MNRLRAMKRTRAAGAGLLVLVLAACGGTPSETQDRTAAAAETTDAALLTVPAAAADEPIVEVVAAIAPSVVTVTSDVHVLTPFGTADDRAVGTGFVVRADGFVLTNQHVIDGASTVTVTLASGEEHAATVLEEDLEHDLAVLEIDAVDLPAVTLGSSDGLAIGETVVAIGYALDLTGGPTVTSGIISSLERTIEMRDSTDVRTYEGLLQTDAALNRGNSGGPLVTLDGLVVGVNVAAGDGVENIGFAIPIDVAQPLLKQAFGEAA
jgi:serine protease Do